MEKHAVTYLLSGHFHHPAPESRCFCLALPPTTAEAASSGHQLARTELDGAFAVHSVVSDCDTDVPDVTSSSQKSKGRKQDLSASDTFRAEL